MTTVKDTYRSYARARTRLVQATNAFDESEKAYINALLDDQGLKLGSMIQSKDGKTVIKIEEVVVDNGKGILSAKGPVRKKDGTISDGQRRNIMADKGKLIAYVD